jgi:selenocysteine-specific elongation factor
VHLGTAEVTATLALFETNELRPGSTTLGQLFLAEPVVAVSGQPFVIREESPPATLGGGRVLVPSARRIRRRDKAEIARIGKLRSTDPVERAEAALGGFGLRPLSDLDLCREAGLALGQVAGTVEALADSGKLVKLPVGPRRTVRLPTEVVAVLEDRVIRALGRLHAARPRQSAIPRSSLAAELPDLESDALVVTVVERLRSQGRVICDARTIALKGHEPKLSQGERRLKTELAESIKAGGFSPPEAAELAAAAGARAAVVPELLALLQEEERIVAVSPQLFLDYEAAAELRRRVVGKLAGGATMTMAELRDLLGTTRKYAVPIGEYLDRTGITLRDGDTRRIGPAASAS